MVKAWEGESASLIEIDTLLKARYRVRSSLSYGGFGETFEVWDEQRPLVDGGFQVKVLKVLNLGRFYDPTNRRKSIDLFQREARVLSRLNHPGIPRVDPDGYFVWPEHASAPLHCLVMEFIEGHPLDSWIRLRNNEPLEEELAIAWLGQLAHILQAIHEEGLIHRDIKPSNIILTSSGQLVLIDFGAVRDATATYLQGHSGSMTGTRIFAAGYTPHEQAEGRARAESDFFAMGRTFVHLLSGIHPMGLNIDEQTGKLVWRDYVPHVSDWLAELLDQMMEPFPGNRPRTAREILEQLDRRGRPPDPPGTTIQDGLIVRRSASWTRQQPFSSIDAWTSTRLRQTLQGHGDQVRAIAISPSSDLLASASYDGSLKLWSLPGGECTQTLTEHAGRVTAVAISADGSLMASGGYDRLVRIWSLPVGQLLYVLPRQAETIQSLAFNPEQPILASATGTTIQLWSTQNGALMHTLASRFKSIRSLAFAADGRTIAVGSLTGTVELWNTYSRKLVWRTSRQAEGMTLVAFSPDGKMLASAGGSSIECFSLTQQRSTLLETHQMAALTAIAFSPDGQLLASASGRNVDLWHVAKRKRLSSPLKTHQRPVRSLAFTPNGQMLISASSDHCLGLWQPRGV